MSATEGGAFAHAGRLSQALDNGLQEGIDIERTGELSTERVQQRRALGAPVEAVVETRVDDRLAGDLPETTQKVEPSECARLASEHGGHTHDAGALDQRDDHARAKPVGGPHLALLLARAHVSHQVHHDDRLPAAQRQAAQRERGQGELGPRPRRDERVLGVDREQCP